MRRLSSLLLVFLTVSIVFTFLNFNVSTVQANPDTNTWEIKASGDDTRGRTDCSAFSSTIGYVQIGNALGYSIICSLKYFNVTIPQRATITSANLTFTARYADTGTTVNGDIYGNDIGNATAPTTCAELNALTKTANKTDWNNIGAWAIDSQYVSPSITSIIQEIVDRSDWTFGNVMQFIVVNDGSSSGTYRRAYDFDNSPTKTVKLKVTWTLGFPTYSDVGTNATIAGRTTKFYCKWTAWSSDYGLSGFIFGYNNTGLWQNDTWTDPWSGEPNSGWSNVSKTINSTVGVKVQYQFWCNDTTGQWGDADTQITDKLALETSTVIQTFHHSYGRKSFKSNSYYWLFYTDGTNMVYQPSVDGKSGWYSPTLVKSCDRGYEFYLWYEKIGSNEYFDLAYCSEEKGDPVIYVMGTINDVFINWGSEQTVVEGNVSLNYYVCSICRDTSDYPYILYGSRLTSEGEPYVTKSSVKNGSWIEDWTHKLYDTNLLCSGQILQLPNDQIYAIYCSGSLVVPNLDYAYGELWNGSSWQGQEIVSDHHIKDNYRFSAESDSQGNIYFTYLWYNNNLYTIHYRERNSTSWKTEEWVTNTTSIHTLPRLSIKSVGNIYVFWWANNKIYLRMKNATGWQTEQNPFGTSFTVSETFNYYDNLVCYGAGITFWIEGDSSPYKIYEGILYQPPPVIITNLSQAIETSWSILTQSTFNILPSLALAVSWIITIMAIFSIGLSQSLTTSWTVLAQSTFNVLTSVSTTFSWLIDITLIVGAKQYIADLTQTISTTWTFLVQWNALATLSQSLATTWQILTQSNFITNLSQTTSTSWMILTQSTYNVLASISQTFSWTVETIVIVGAQHYIADLTQTVTITWTVLTQWNAIADLSQTIGTTWTVLTQTAFNIVPSLSVVTLWIVDTFTGIAYSVELSVTITAQWIINIVTGVTPPINFALILGAFGSVMAIIAIALVLRRRGTIERGESYE